MQAKTIISVLAIAIGASTLPTTETSGQNCAPNQVLACCASIATNGTGIDCLLSTLNVLNSQCAVLNLQSVGCCNQPQSGTVNVNLAGCITV